MKVDRKIEVRSLGVTLTPSMTADQLKTLVGKFPQLKKYVSDGEGKKTSTTTTK